MKRKEKGITLIALVITIIVLLILAGVAINAMIGEGSIIENANKAVSEYNNSVSNTQELLNEITEYMNRVETNDIEEDKLIADGTWSEKKQVNTPKLVDGMIPIKYNETEGVWEITYDEDEWYNYKTEADGNAMANQWANVMLSDGKYKAGTTAVEGTKVKEDELGSMFVWIPRYAYSITSNYHNGGEGIKGTIEVEFLKGTSYTSASGRTTWDNESGLDKWNVHPAFTDGSTNDYANGGWDQELSGIWVAKFEASSSSPELDYGGGDVTNLDVKVLPNVVSWKHITIANIFSNCLDMNKTGNIYGIPSNAVTHLMKNSEWGAVAYLTQSKYGRNGNEVTINNSSSYITGNAANSVSEEANESGITNAYNTDEGTLASTTGTVYGIYDMSGGAWEYVAAGLTDNIDNGNESTARTKEHKWFFRKASREISRL